MKTSPFQKGFQFAAVLGGGMILLMAVNAWMPVSADAKSEVKATPLEISETNTLKPLVEESEKLSPTETPSLPPALLPLSPGMAEVIRLAQSNVSEEVLIAYIQKANFTFEPSVDEILYLNDLGVSDKVITSLLNRAKVEQEVAKAPSSPAAVPETAPSENEPAESVSPNETIVESPPHEISSTVADAPPVPETEPVVAPQPETPVTINYFYESLSPYGNWMEVDGYGLCWQPSVVVNNPSWRPYSDRGRWIYSDCGWYWQSDYSWGWAPFHYGRWHRSPRHNWVWVPDRTWGPAWVSWRYTDDHCGWAPLPPSAVFHHGSGFRYRNSNVGIHFDFGLTSDCYTFVPTRRFCDPHPYRYRASSIRGHSLYGRSKVNNHYFVKNNTVVNHGIAPSTVVAATGTDLKKVRVQNSPVPQVNKPEILDKKSNTIATYRPEISKPVKNENALKSSPLSPKQPTAFRPGSATLSATKPAPVWTPTRPSLAPAPQNNVFSPPISKQINTPSTPSFREKAPEAKPQPTAIPRALQSTPVVTAAPALPRASIAPKTAPPNPSPTRSNVGAPTLSPNVNSSLNNRPSTRPLQPAPAVARPSAPRPSPIVGAPVYKAPAPAPVAKVWTAPAPVKTPAPVALNKQPSVIHQPAVTPRIAPSHSATAPNRITPQPTPVVRSQPLAPRSQPAPVIRQPTIVGAPAPAPRVSAPPASRPLAPTQNNNSWNAKSARPFEKK